MSNIEAPRKTESGLLIYDAALGRLCSRRRELAQVGIEQIMEPWGQFYRAQKRDGFYATTDVERIMGAASRDPQILSPYTLVRKEKGELSAIDYRDVPPFKDLLIQTSQGMYEYMAKARALGLEDAGSIVASLRPQADALNAGDFEMVMRSRLMTRQPGKPGVLVALLDRYLDTLMNRKLSAQGWMINHNFEMIKDVRELLEKSPKIRALGHKFKVVVGDTLVMVGVGVEKDGWSGNGVPSEEELRQDEGMELNAFHNSIVYKFGTVRKPALERYLQDSSEYTKHPGRFVDAAFWHLIFHEAGHGLIEFDDLSVQAYGSNYTAYKEKMAEVFGLEEFLKMPHSAVRPEMKKAVALSSLTMAMKNIVDYHKETDPDKKIVARSYMLAAAVQLNYLSRLKAITISDNGRIAIENMGLFIHSIENLANNLRSLSETEKGTRGDLRAWGKAKDLINTFLELNKESPTDFSNPRYNGHDNHDNQPLVSISA